MSSRRAARAMDGDIDMEQLTGMVDDMSGIGVTAAGSRGAQGGGSPSPLDVDLDLDALYGDDNGFASLDDLALEDLGNFLVPLNSGSGSGPRAADAPGSYIGYVDEDLTGVGGGSSAGTVGYSAGTTRPAAATSSSGLGGVARTTTTHKRAPATVASMSAMAQTRRPAAKRARTRYTAVRKRADSSAGGRGGGTSGTASGGASGAARSRSGSQGDGAVPEHGRKVRKNNRERLRRQEVNDSFQALADLLQVKRKTKSDKVTVLHAALDEIRRLREEVAGLRLRANATVPGPVPAEGMTQPLQAHPLPTGVQRVAQPSGAAGHGSHGSDSDVAAAAQASFQLLMQEQRQQPLPLAVPKREPTQQQQGTVGIGSSGDDTLVVATPASLLASRASVTAPAAMAPAVVGSDGVGAGGIDMAAAAVVAAGIDPDDVNAEDALLELETDVNMFDQVFA